MHFGFAFEHKRSWRPAGREFCHEINRGRFFALKVSAQFAFNQRRFANHAGAAEIALGGEMNLAASSDRSAETGGDFVIPKVDVGAATRAISRSRGFADFVFSLAFKAGNYAIALPAPKTLDPAEASRFASRAPSLGAQWSGLATTLGAPGENERPHWRHIVVLAAAYSICLKPQCGHSTLTLAGDGFATG